MRKFALTMLSLLTVLTLLVACGPAPTEPPAEATEPPAAEPTEVPPTEPPAEEAMKIGMVTDVGGIDDKSFNASGWAGMQRAEAELGVEVAYLESQQQTDYAANITQFLDQDYALIVTVGFLLGDDTATFAQENPDTSFAIVDFAYDPVIPNVLGLTFATDQAAFLAGYAAAGMSQTGKVGTFGGIEIPPVTIFMVGFENGVEYYNEVHGTNVEALGCDLFCGNFESTDDGRRYAEDLIAEGADIIMPVAGPVGLGTAAAVQENPGTMLIGVDTDWCVSAPEYCDVTLTSVMKNIDVAVYTSIEQVVEGTFEGGFYVGTLENGGVGLGPFNEFEDDVPADLKAELEDLEAALIAGTISTGWGVAEEVPEAPPAEGGPLRVTFSWPTFIDPAVGNDFSSSTSLANIYDTLVFPNAEGGLDPWLAESWEVSDDGLTYTFHLRQGVKFHDGSELLAGDVVYSFERLQTVGEGYAYLITGVEGVTAVDDYTVEFTLERPSGLFVPSLVRLYVANEDLVRENTLAEGPYGEDGDYGKEWLLTHDAGSGPYQVVEFPLEEYLLMEKFGDWWNADAFHPNAPGEARFIATTETATVRALMDDGDLEITDQWQTIEALEALDAMEGVGTMAFPTMTGFYYMMNTRKPPLDDVHCRRAIAYAFDYDAAVALEWPGTQQMVGPVPQTVGGHNPDVFVFERDLDKAADELAQCQYAGDIASYPVEVMWIAEVPAEEKWALLFQANMADINVPVEVVSQPWLSVVEDTSSQETSPHIVTIYVSTDLPEAGLMLQQRYHSSTANTWQQNEWLLDEGFDAAVEEALATADPEERFAKYAELQDYIAELAPSLFLYDQLEKHAVADYVEWAPEANSAVMGYQIYAPWIGVTSP